jgi:hypothetical protein
MRDSETYCEWRFKQANRSHRRRRAETVKTHVRNIFIKLSVKNRVQAVSRAQNLGLVVIDDAMFLQ